jgi:hypothetical protein
MCPLEAEYVLLVFSVNHKFVPAEINTKTNEGYRLAKRTLRKSAVLQRVQFPLTLHAI